MPNPPLPPNTPPLPPPLPPTPPVLVTTTVMSTKTIIISIAIIVLIIITATTYYVFFISSTINTLSNTLPTLKESEQDKTYEQLLTQNITVEESLLTLPPTYAVIYHRTEYVNRGEKCSYEGRDIGAALLANTLAGGVGVDNEYDPKTECVDDIYQDIVAFYADNTHNVFVRGDYCEGTTPEEEITTFCKPVYSHWMNNEFIECKKDWIFTKASDGYTDQTWGMTCSRDITGFAAKIIAGDSAYHLGYLDFVAGLRGVKKAIELPKKKLENTQGTGLDAGLQVITLPDRTIAQQTAHCYQLKLTGKNAGWNLLTFLGSGYPTEYCYADNGIPLYVIIPYTNGETVELTADYAVETPKKSIFTLPAPVNN